MEIRKTIWKPVIFFFTISTHIILELIRNGKSNLKYVDLSIQTEPYSSFDIHRPLNYILIYAARFSFEFTQ